MDQVQAAAPYIAEALDDVVERVLGAQKVPGLRLDLPCFLEEQADLHELVSTAIVSRDFQALDELIEKRLRVALQDNEVVLDRADEIARDRAEDARDRL
jgi:hypothetical protein